MDDSRKAKLGYDLTRQCFGDLGDYRPGKVIRVFRKGGSYLTGEDVYAEIYPTANQMCLYKKSLCDVAEELAFRLEIEFDLSPDKDFVIKTDYSRKLAENVPESGEELSDMEKGINARITNKEWIAMVKN